jgi:hypothetical protein
MSGKCVNWPDIVGCFKHFLARPDQGIFCEEQGNVASDQGIASGGQAKT